MAIAEGQVILHAPWLTGGAVPAIHAVRVLEGGRDPEASGARGVASCRASLVRRLDPAGRCAHGADGGARHVQCRRLDRRRGGRGTARLRGGLCGSRTAVRGRARSADAADSARGDGRIPRGIRLWLSHRPAEACADAGGGGGASLSFYCVDKMNESDLCDCDACCFSQVFSSADAPAEGAITFPRMEMTPIPGLRKSRFAL